ncbi:MAG: tRNA (adenosine(37)-N6)-dimethylallyltransferase MiaA [Candidatus Saccharibacteria bacterium]
MHVDSQDNKLIPPLLVIVGETASGKSALALDIALELNGEIICADSWTVRREVNIGTAKPSLIDQGIVAHHLIDIVDPCEDFTAAVFKSLAVDKIKRIAARGKLPILVGGTGLYIDSIIYDYGFLPEGDREAREALNGLSNNELLGRIQQLGLELGDVDIRNKRRLIRLIETSGARPTRQVMRSNTVMIGLCIEREVLQKNITQRVDHMLEAGLAAEVANLANRYGWGCEALKGVGYSQWREYYLGTQSLEVTRAKIIKATLDLAKRQRTWFKRNKSIHWLNTPVETTSIVELVTTLLNK